MGKALTAAIIFLLSVGNLLTLLANAQEPSAGPFENIAERIERRADRIEQRAISLEGSVREHGRLLERAGGALDRVGTVLRGLWWLVVAAVAAYSLRQVVDLVAAVGKIIRPIKPKE